MDKYRALFNMNINMIDFIGKLFMTKRAFFLFKNRKFLRKNKELLEKKSHDVCYILGNGPSLKNIDFSNLHGDTIVTNMFHKSENLFDFDPKFYLMIDEQFYIGEIKKEIQKVSKKFPNTTLLLNGLYKDYVDELLPKEKDRYYLYAWNGAMRRKKVIDCSKVLPAINNVVNIAICIALYMNYSEIILLGCDFSSFASMKKVHFYKEEEDTRNMTLAYELFNYSLVAEAHLELDLYAKDRGIKILNATKGSLIDAYERIPCDSIEKK